MVSVWRAGEERFSASLAPPTSQAGNLLVALLDNGAGQHRQVVVDNAAADGLLLALAVAALPEALVA